MAYVKNTMIDALLSMVAPHLCSGCGQIGSTFCDNCKYNISQEPFSGCILCQKPQTFGICQEHNSSYNQAFVVGERRGPLQRLIGGYKFKNMKATSVALAELLDARLPELPAGTVFVPVPTSPAHIRERGYDHMLLITKQLAKFRKLPIQRLLVRHNTLTQHHANRKDRLEQAKSAYQVNGMVNPLLTYVIVDDVVTTGATIEQAALQLRHAGAEHIWVAAIARQPLD